MKQELYELSYYSGHCIRPELLANLV